MLKVVLTSFFVIILVELALHTVSLLGELVICTYTLFGTLNIHYGNRREVMALDSGSDDLCFFLCQIFVVFFCFVFS